jgi:hypothetical protein
VLPLSSCGARLPTYALTIPAFCPTAWPAHLPNADTAARADAQTWLTAINEGSFKNAALANLVGLVAINSDGEKRQDFVAQVVPIPTAAWLFGSAIVGAVALGRRKKKAEDKA